MPESDATWVFGNRAMCYGYNEINELYDVSITGDTTTGNLSYRQLTSRRIRKYSGSECPDLIHGYIGGFRQDINVQKVYIVPPDSINEQLLYDFNLEVGDTLQGYLTRLLLPEHRPFYMVSFIDTVFIDSTLRRRWNFPSGYNVSIIEGVGSSSGLVNPYPAWMDFDEVDLLCFEQSGVPLFPDTTVACNTINVKVFADDSEQIRISPNPFTNQTTISQLPVNSSVKI